MCGSFKVKSKPRILMLLLEYYPMFTGHGIYLEQLISKLQSNNCDVAVLTADFNMYSHFQNVEGVKVYRFHFSFEEKFWEIKLSFRVIFFLLKNVFKYDVLHMHGHLDIYGLITIFSKMVRKKVVSQMVLLGSDDPISLKRTYKFMSIRLKLLAFADRFICISKPLVDSCVNSGISLNKITYIQQGVDTDKFSPPATYEEKLFFKEKLGFSKHANIVVFVGSIVERKGVDFLVEAWVNIQKIHKDAMLVLVGQDDFDGRDINKNILNKFVNDIKFFIKNNELNVFLVGKKTNVDEYYKIADVFVLPSRKEGFGNVILEAMSSGVPAVVSYMDGIAEETILHGENGYITYSIDDISKWISKLLSNKLLAKKLGGHGRQKTLDKFCMNRIALRYVDVYRQILK